MQKETAGLLPQIKKQRSMIAAENMGRKAQLTAAGNEDRL